MRLIFQQLKYKLLRSRIMSWKQGCDVEQANGSARAWQNNKSGRGTEAPCGARRNLLSSSQLSGPNLLSRVRGSPGVQSHFQRPLVDLRTSLSIVYTSAQGIIPILFDGYSMRRTCFCAAWHRHNADLASFERITVCAPSTAPFNEIMTARSSTRSLFRLRCSQSLRGTRMCLRAWLPKPSTFGYSKIFLWQGQKSVC